MPVKQISDGNPDGTVIGQSGIDKVGFYGIATPVVQVALPPVATDLTTALTLVNAMRARDVANGISR